MKQRRSHRSIRMLTSMLLVGVIAAGCGAVDDDITPSAAPAPVGSSASEPRVVSAEEGAAARTRFTPLSQSAELAPSGDAAMSSSVSCMVDNVATPEQVAESNADNVGLVEAFDRFGVEYTSSTDESGYLLVDYAYDDVVVQSVADSYWNTRYPVLPVPQEELDGIVAQNDVIAEQLDAAGVTYVRTTDEAGYEIIEYDYEDPTAQDAVNAAWSIIFPLEAPTAEQLAQQNDDNAKLMAAFDEAGIAYELVSDELGWAWLEWDDQDPATADEYVAILDELFPPMSIDPVVECAFVDGPIEGDLPAVEPIEIDMPVDEIDVVRPDDGPTPEQVLQRDAEVNTMIDGFTAAMVDFEVRGESPWQTVVFDLADDASIPVVAAIVSARG